MLVLTLVVAASHASLTFGSDVNNYDFILTLFKKAECSNRGPESLLDNITRGTEVSLRCDKQSALSDGWCLHSEKALKNPTCSA